MEPVHLVQANASAAASRPLSAWLPQLATARPVGAYVHVPFCFHKCHYCDFYSFVDTKDRQEAFVDRLLAEARVMSGLVHEPMQTLFVGGGTPTLLADDRLLRLLRGLRELLPWAGGAEWTVEANPETITAAKADVLASCGVTRVSMGAQSFQPALLQQLERHHEPASVARAMGLLRSAGIARLNIDLIFAIPTSTLVQWQDDLAQALALAPDHLSCYGLVYEPGTPLRARLEAGGVERLDEELEASMYEHTVTTLAAAGYHHYEISNWARPGQECRHNLLYWEDGEWIALGPSASGHAAGLRWKNVAVLQEWLDEGPWAPVRSVEALDEDGRIGEAFLMGLRLLDGMHEGRVQSLLGRGTRAVRRKAAIDAAVARGDMVRSDGRLRFSERGVLTSDSVLRDLL
ncbi:MAG: radical SAM family heme chaperone HemW [Planctomycetes bacterium]|nr:radical SAM family heme chaperone HemW [Planctomycetota bacterium]